jgi:hypothetical protein
MRRLRMAGLYGVEVAMPGPKVASKTRQVVLTVLALSATALLVRWGTGHWHDAVLGALVCGFATGCVVHRPQKAPLTPHPVEDGPELDSNGNDLDRGDASGPS